MANILINRGFYKLGFALTKISGRFWWTGAKKWQSELILSITVRNVLLKARIKIQHFRKEVKGLEASASLLSTMCNA
jgi:hypothetical protein